MAIEAWADGMPRVDGVGLIGTERLRQITEKGFTAQHDRQHGDHELIDCVDALLFLILHRTTPKDLIRGNGKVQLGTGWPGERAIHVLEKYYDGTSAGTIKMLAVAGAMVAAEIDRLKLETAHADSPTAS